MDVNGEEAILRFIKVFELIVVRSLGEFAVQAVRPAVIATRKNVCPALVFLDDCVCAMATDVVEGVDLWVRSIKTTKSYPATV